MRLTRVAGIMLCLAPPSALGQIAPVTLQWFETSWSTMEDRTADAFMAGYARVWTPPPSKADGGQTTGYDLFDRFDLGTPNAPTRYGARADLAAVVAEQDKAGIATFIDLILNHNGFRTDETPGFEAEGGYPGFVFDWPGNANGDFNPEWLDCGSNRYICRVSGLIDIDQYSNNWMIRHPVDADDPQNIPAGTLYNKVDADNRQLYPDLSLPANTIGIPPFNLDDPMAGDPEAENAAGLLMRNVRWLLEMVGVDGFRIDAAKHVPEDFWRDYYDRHVWQRGDPLLDGTPVTPFSFLEVYDGDWGLLDDYVCKGGTGHCNTSGGVQGNRDVLDFPLFFAMNNELNGTGLGTWYNIVGASVDGIFDGNSNDGDFGVQFVQSHDNGGAVMDNLAYAYILMRTGSPIVYFMAEEFGPVGFPEPGRGDALGGQYGGLLTTLVDIHNEYARGPYLQRWIDNDLLVFERSNACLVGLNDRGDSGYDERTVSTGFAPNLRLHELTGNATDATVDPNDDIFDVITVGAGGQVTLRVPRVKNVNGVTHDRNYVVYGPVNPDGELTVSNVADTIPADPPGEPNGTRRLTAIDVIQSDSFEVKLETDDADPLDDGEDDLAMLRMDAGLDINGNGSVDSTDPGFAGYGYEHFLTEAVSLESGGVDVGGGVFRGRYRQVIDATLLSEGRHYLSVIAFRSRPPDSPSVFETWRKVLLLDRVPPQMALSDPSPGTAVTSAIHQFVVRSPDRTANKVHIFLDQPPGTDVIAMAEAGQGLATQLDRDSFGRTFSNLEPGHHRLDVVAYEATRPDPGVTTFTGILVEIDGFDGLGDVTGDGYVTNRDIWTFILMVQAGGMFHPAGDMDGNGVVDGDDVPLFEAKLYGDGTPQGMSARYPLDAGRDDPADRPQAPATDQSFFWLQHDGAASQFGSVTNPVLDVHVGESLPLYLWFNDDSAPSGFDGVSFDVKLESGDGGRAQVVMAIDEPAGRWEGATGGTVRTDGGGDGVDDANAFDLTNTDTLPAAPARFAELTVTGESVGTVELSLCIGGLGIADSGNNALVYLGFANGLTTPETALLSGGWFGFCTGVPEAVINVLPSGVAADFDFDGDVDSSDFGHLQACLSGSTFPQTDPDCADALLSDDAFVNEQDVAIFLNCMSGADVPADPGCAD